MRQPIDDRGRVLGKAGVEKELAYMDEMVQQRSAGAADEDYEKLRKAATKVLLDYLGSSTADAALEKRARMAQATLASVTRHEASKTARRVVDFAMARSLARDRNELEEYVRLSTPDAAIARALRPPRSVKAPAA